VKMTLLYGFNVIFQNALLHLQFDIPLQQLLRSVCTASHYSLFDYLISKWRNLVIYSSALQCKAVKMMLTARVDRRWVPAVFSDVHTILLHTINSKSQHSDAV